MTRRAPIAAGREHTGDRQTDEVWGRLGALARVVNGSPFVNGRLITEEDYIHAVPRSGLEFYAGVARSIPHRLGRKASGFIEVYGVDLVSDQHVGLRPVAHPDGFSSETHISVLPTSDGWAWVWVF